MDEQEDNLPSPKPPAEGETTNHEDSILNNSVNRGTKRKSSLSDTPGKASKIPRYEPEPNVELEAKTIYIPENENFVVLSRNTLTTIPPKQGNFGVGDLIWARIQGFPFWPCIITIDPQSGIYSKISGVSYKADRVYHIQYFGDTPCRGWTNVGCVFSFEGIDEFYTRVEKELENLNSKQATKVLSKYIVKPSLKKSWNRSVAEAIEAMKLDKQERVRLLTFNYAYKNDAKPAKEGKRKSEAAATPNKPKLNKSTAMSGRKAAKPKKRNSLSKKSDSPEDVYNFKEDSDGFDNLGKLTLKNRNAKGDFQVYLRKHFQDECKTNPDLSPTQVSNELRQKWNKLTDYERTFYIERNARFEDESNMFVSKRANLGDDYGFSDDESVYESNDESAMNKTEENNDISIRSVFDSAKSKRSKSKKSEKLFDKIKNDSDGGSETPKKKKVSEKKAKNAKTKVDEEPKSNKRGSVKNTLSSKASESTAKNLGELDDSESEHSDTISQQGDSKKAGDAFCQVCHNDKSKPDLLCCEGICNRYYHKDCIGLKKDVASYYCEECTNNKFKCFECKQYQCNGELETKKCENSNCPRFYHLSCIENYPIRVNETANSFLCPLHACNTCHVESIIHNEFRDTSKRRLKTCIICPTAYHANDHCIAAGTIKLSKSSIVCPNHYPQGKFQKKGERQVNVNYCFSCSRGGNLICCESCPAAFHENCIEQPFDNEKSFFCTDCQLRRPLHYGGIVWVKYASYRWWPGKICHPRDVPENVKNTSHNDGDFPVYFFGSHDYQWLNKGRTFRFEEGDNSNLTMESSKKGNKSLKKLFQKSVEEAAEAYKNWDKTQEEYLKTLSRKPSHYITINSNRYPGQKNNSNGNKVEMPICDCKANEKDEFCTDESCLNRASLIECDPKKCVGKEACKNQRFRRNEYINSEYFRTKETGWGLKTLVDLKEGDFVIEYVGEIIDDQEYQKRIKKINNRNYYFLTIDKDTIIDAGPKGNLSRFINHSCDPNCITQKWLVNNQTRVGIFALKDIPAGTELTFNYNFENFDSRSKVKCHCDAANCSGFIGVPPPKIEAKKNGVNGSKATKNGSKSRTKASSSGCPTDDENSRNASGTPLPKAEMNGEKTETPIIEP